MVEVAPLNPRAVPGSNQAPDYAQQVTDRIAAEYSEVTKTLDGLLDEARGLPKIVTNDSDALMIGALIKRLRDVDGRIESVRGLEKEPYLRGGNAVDSFFNALRDKIGRRNKNDRKQAAGAVDVLQARINTYQDEKLARERARLEADRRVAEEAARVAAQKAADEAAAAELARLKALRARTEETTKAKAALAEQQEREADEARIRAQQAADQAEEARLASLARPADIARVRGNDTSGAGVTLTVAKEPYAILTDRNKVNMEMLRPYFTDAEIEKALRGWAKATGFRIAMEGAEVGHRNRGVTR